MGGAIATARTVAAKLISLLPEGARLAIAPSLQGYSRNDIPAALRAESSHPSMLIAPANSAGQGSAWATAVTRETSTRAVNLSIVAENDAFQYPANSRVRSTIAARSEGWSRAQARAAQAFTTVIIESARAPFGRSSGGDLEAQIARLTAAGVSVALLWHGSDIRSPRRNAQIEPFSPFRDETDPYTQTLQAGADAAAQLADRSGLTEFVSTPDLLRDRPHAVWVPVVVDVTAWPVTPWEPGERPRVLHAPSRRRLKGTDLVWDTLTALDAEGIIDLVVAENVAHADMPALVASCDVLLDQFALGIYGVAALEAMAAGRLVISHVAPDVRRAAEAAAGQELPIVEATPDTIDGVLRAVRENPEQFRSIVQAGRPFVDTLHDGRHSARVLTSRSSEAAR